MSTLAALFRPTFLSRSLIKLLKLVRRPSDGDRLYHNPLTCSLQKRWPNLMATPKLARSNHVLISRNSLRDAHLALSASLRWYVVKCDVQLIISKNPTFNAASSTPEWSRGSPRPFCQRAVCKKSTLGHFDGLHALNGSIGLVCAFASGG